MWGVLSLQGIRGKMEAAAAVGDDDDDDNRRKTAGAGLFPFKHQRHPVSIS